MLIKPILQISHVRDWRNRQTIRQAYLVYPDDDWERLLKFDERYVLGDMSPHYPMPAIPLQVKYDYMGCVNIDDVSDPDDPVIVWMYDSWNQINC